MNPALIRVLTLASMQLSFSKYASLAERVVAGMSTVKEPLGKRYLLRASTCVALVLAAILLLTSRHVIGDETSTKNEVVATVGRQTIHASEIHREVRRATSGRFVDRDRYMRVSKSAIDQAVKRRLVVAFLTRHNSGATEDEIQQRLDLVKRKLSEQDVQLPDYLARTGMTEDELRFSLAWEIAWGRYTARYLKNANLQKYFEKHRRDFDGTKMQVAHILWKLKSRDEDVVKSAMAKARTVRESIVGGTLTFADAARKHSSAPTKETGGDIGEIERRAPMPDDFSRVAFTLNEGEVSEPVTTSFGVHLIKCLKVTPGERTWQDARNELQSAVERYLFDWTVEQERPRATVKVHAADGLEPPKKE